MSKADNLVTRQEAANYLKVSTRTIDRWVSENRIQQYKANGTQWVWLKKSDLDKMATVVEADVPNSKADSKAVFEVSIENGSLVKSKVTRTEIPVIMMDNVLSGQAVLEQRTGGGMSQSQLADMMAALRFNWHQTTVRRTEDGSRPLRLDEAFALSQIFSVHVTDLVWYSE